MALYPNWLNEKLFPLLVISGFKISKNPLTINSIIDINLNLRFNESFYFDGKIIEIKLPDLFTVPESVESIEENGLMKLDGDLKILKSLIDVNSNKLFIIGITNNRKIFKGKILNLTLKRINVGEYFLINEKIEVYLYYKNSYSIISYSNIKGINTIPYGINDLEVTHPENMNVYIQTVSPLLFSFTLPSNTIEGYVVIKHENLNNYKTKVNFIASTCDFSKTTFFSEELGQRPICFNYRNDLDFGLLKDDVNDKPNGSAIVFKLPKLQIGNSTNLKINLLVFNNNDQCGSSSKSNGENKSQFSFSVKIFKYMDMKKFN